MTDASREEDLEFAIYAIYTDCAVPIEHVGTCRIHTVDT